MGLEAWYIHYLNWHVFYSVGSNTTTDRLHSKTLLTIDERGPKIASNSVFDCHLLPAGRQMAIENTVSSEFGSAPVVSIAVFHCHLSGVNIFTLHIIKGLGQHENLSLYT